MEELLTKRQIISLLTMRKRRTGNRYHGISFEYAKGLWSAQIGMLQNRKVVRGFETEEQAARKYDELALEMYGRYAQLNFPPEDRPNMTLEEYLLEDVLSGQYEEVEKYQTEEEKSAFLYGVRWCSLILKK